MSGKDEQHLPAKCENCGTPLQGHYCYVCGQSMHNPTRHFGHAVEEVLESFWHLDGRVFRTLRDLMVPGRVTLNYLAGQRVRYIAPIRLFVILSLLTFFIGKLVVHVDQAPIHFGGEGGAALEKAQTIAEVKQIESRLLAKLSVDEKKAARTPGVNPALVATRVAIEGAAANRIAELEEIAKDRAEGKSSAKAADSGKTKASEGRDNGAAAARTDGVAEAARTEASDGQGSGAATAPTSVNAKEKETKTQDDDDTRWRFNDREWDEKTNPVEVSFLPGFANRWINHKIGRAKNNIEQMDGDPNRFIEAFLGAVPTALFLLMPVFALLLKVFYLGSGRRYLEHVVVALYSHAWLLVFLLALFLLNAVKDAFSANWVAVLTSLLSALLWMWVPIYLWVMQHRVYRDHWLVTTLRYVVIGSIYMVLVLFVVAFAMVSGLSS
ncbi:DUF3667 domain-containing protein [Lysobacter sp. Root494]|uniref:DUF3667 domain-containing protein n=1 Tax=Lysobacter sp. Root494 TaxID=1736549 RepID=UPI0006F7613B|nr:DUF3667 domain-containing protein [Lysobacter sp. Root494]KQY54846.1 hypothetical protein ASD14_01335 [Lysobacter sp. Root494]